MHWIDPDSLPETRGTVTRFLLNPHGELDGFVLGSRQLQQVHFPPHLSRQVARLVAVGDTVRVRGVKPRGADMIAAVSLTSKTGKVILDEGPHRDGEKHHHPDAERTPMEASGEVLLSLFGPKGELRGALWTMARCCACRRMPPPSWRRTWRLGRMSMRGDVASGTGTGEPLKWTRSPNSSMRKPNRNSHRG